VSTHHFDLSELKLTPYEGPPGPQHVIQFEGWVMDGDRDDLALVRLEPPLSTREAGVQRDTSKVIIATRHAGHTLRSITETPVHVYVTVPKSGQDLDGVEIGSIDTAELTIVMWALLVGIKE
jgi:hypothetical protein